MYPEPTTEEPTLEELMEWADEGMCMATDGCEGIETDGACPHSYPSWLLQLSMI